jgi:putative amide transporter protein
MAAVGLFYVGAVLFVNGLMLLGKVDPRAAGFLNLFVGVLQVVVPTVLLIQAQGDPDRVLAAAGLYLFGFTYLYVGLNLLTGADSTGVGWFSLFVSISALGFSYISFRDLGDAPFGVIWLYWSFLWLLFFLLLGLKRTELTTYTGYVTVVQAWVTAAIPGFLLFTGYWRGNTETAVALALIGLVMAVGLWPLAQRQSGPPARPPADRPAGQNPARP